MYTFSGNETWLELKAGTELAAGHNDYCFAPSLHLFPSTQPRSRLYHSEAQTSLMTAVIQPLFAQEVICSMTSLFPAQACVCPFGRMSHSMWIWQLMHILFQCESSAFTPFALPVHLPWFCFIDFNLMILYQKILKMTKSMWTPEHHMLVFLNCFHKVRSAQLSRMSLYVVALQFDWN